MHLYMYNLTVRYTVQLWSHRVMWGSDFMCPSGEILNRGPFFALLHCISYASLGNTNSESLPASLLNDTFLLFTTRRHSLAYSDKRSHSDQSACLLSISVLAALSCTFCATKTRLPAGFESWNVRDKPFPHRHPMTIRHEVKVFADTP